MTEQDGTYTCKIDKESAPNISYTIGNGKPPYKSRITIGEAHGYRVEIGVAKKFNWFQRLMIKWCFGFTVENC